MRPHLDDEAIEAGRHYFINYVRGRGPLPAFRIGTTPYGIVPVSSLKRWQASTGATGAQRHLPPLLKKLLGYWQKASALAPHLDPAKDPDEVIFRILELDASARSVFVRPVLPYELHLNLFLRTDQQGEIQFAWDVLGAIGQPSWKPRIGGMVFDKNAPRYAFPFVAAEPLSESDPLKVNYIRWIREQTSLEKLRDGYPGGLDALLYHLLSHSAQLEFYRVVINKLVELHIVNKNDVQERVFYGVATEAGAPTPFQMVMTPVPTLSGERPFSEFLLDSELTVNNFAIFQYRDATGSAGESADCGT